MRTTEQQNNRTILIKIFNLIALLYYSQAFAANQFADTPLHLHNKSITQTSSGPKPNITFFVDDSGSMSSRVSGSRMTRIQVVKNVLKEIVNTYRTQFYYNLEALNGHRSRDDITYNTANSHDYNSLTSRINDLYANGGTPLIRRLFAVTRNTVMNHLKYRCQKSYLIILSDGESSTSQPVEDSDFDGYFDAGGRNNSIFGSRFIYALQYYTDTLRLKSFGNYIYTRPIVGLAGTSISRGDRRRTDDAGQPWDSQNFTQTAQTFTIGFGLSSNSRAAQFLKLGASPKPDYDPNTNPYSRYYFNATSSNDVLNAFQNIFKEIKTQTEINKLNITTHSPMMGESSTEKKNLLIKAKINTADWSSQICFHDRNETKDEKNACNKQPTFYNRKLVLNNNKNSYLYSNAMSDFNNGSFKITNNNDLNKQEWRDGLLSWLSRSTNDENIKKPNFVLDYRQRNNGNARNMGDMINNSIEAIGDEEFGKQKYLVTSANDGMVYVFRATNDNNNPYDLKFNYMPMDIERNSTDGTDLVSHYYKDLTSNSYGKDSTHPHRYLLNGGFTVVETADIKNKPKQIFMVSNMGQAGRGAFAINIGGKDLTNNTVIAADNLNNNNWYKDLFLFQTPTGTGNDFGYTVGKPMVAITRVNKDDNAPKDTYTDHLREAAFINNGFNFPGKEVTNNESALYIYDVLGVDVGTGSYIKTGDVKGTLINKLKATDGNGGLASPVVYDINNDGVADLVYAGDYGGNLYRFDIRDPNPKNWKVTKIFQAEGPITAAPTLFAVNNDNNDPRSSHKVIVVFGTGSDIYESDLESKKQQAIYGIYDDYDQNNLVKKGDLLQQTMTYNGNNGQLSKLPLSSSHKGWYFKLNTDGERVTTSISQLLSTGVVMTTTYDLKRESNNAALSGDPCKAQETIESTSILSRLTQFDTRTGGQLGDKSPRVRLLQNTDTLASSVGVAGLVGLRISTINQYNYLNAGKSGQQKTPGDISPPTKCFQKGKEPHADLSNGDGINLENIPLCGDNPFKRLSWREIKPETGYY